MIGPLIGMVHLGALPGAPGYAGDMEAVIAAAITDAAALEDAGFDAVMVENYGDAPFFADDVPKATVAAMARAVDSVRRAVEVPVGVNVLRNDAVAAISVAATAGAAFIRVNVLSGVMATDQGIVTGRAAEVLRLRRALGTPTRILADVMVKHAAAPVGLSLEETARDAWERGGADGLIVTGPATGSPTSPEAVARVKAVVPGAPVYVGSGVTASTVADLLALADGVVVGTWLKEGGTTMAPVDPERARALVAAARGGSTPL